MARKARRQRAATGNAARIAAKVEDDTMQAANDEGRGAVGIDGVAYDASAIETTLNPEDAEALEQGIASVFDRLRAEAGATGADNDDGDGEAAAEQDQAIGVEPTYALLAELNRLWARAEAA